MPKTKSQPKSWQTTNISSYLSVPPRNGIHKGPKFQGEGTAVVKMGEVYNDDNIRDQKRDRFILSENERNTLVLKKGDLLFCRTSLVPEGIGKSALVSDLSEPTVFASNLIRLRFDKDKSSPRFFAYYFKSTRGKHALRSLARGTSVTTITGPDIAAITDSFPSFIEQEKIANLLSAFDEKIENNNRIIKTLEEMAQAIFKEWFIKKGDLWQQVPFTDQVDILGGGTPSTTNSEYWNGTIPFFAPGDAGESPFTITTEKNITEAGLEKCNSKLYPKNTVFITARGTVGKVVMAGVPMAMNQSCYAFKSKGPFSDFFVFLLVRRAARELRKQAVGGVFDTITTATFKNMRVVLPDQQTLKGFGQVVTPIFEKILATQQENQKLAAMRDLLLPRLMSGEIRL